MADLKLGRVLFDEAHSEAWTIRPDAARSMQPSHPADASLAKAAVSLTERDFVVEANLERPLTEQILDSCDLLVLAHPAEERWERTTGIGAPRLQPAELDAIEAFVRSGGGLVVLGETEQDKYGNNVNDLLARFGIKLENDTVQDYEHCRDAPSWILAELANRGPGGGARGRDGDLLARVSEVCLYRATTISSANGARVLARAHASSSAPGAPLIVAEQYGSGHVVVLADSDLFGDDCIDDFDHRALWLNIAYWAARRPGEAAPRMQAAPPAAWKRLRDGTNALALLQAPDGALADPGDCDVARRHVDSIEQAIEALKPGFPHQTDYLDATIGDLRLWVDQGFGRPDFTRALDAFRPERARRDGVEHLVCFPMYKQNGPRERTFEALIIRVPWPEWIAELERSRYDNPKFVPVELVAGTRGYDSECAVLFPEMVCTAERPVNNFGAIFCDREAERLRRVGGAAAELLALNLPPDAARLLDSPALSEEAYILWDLIHDRTHSHGELPFDPFMIRQRAPYWMYALEELRCDLGAFAQGLELEREGVALARYMQYAILLDRLLRFPITGARLRNYDGLGGQLLFAYLHRHGYLRWEDNQLTIDWPRVSEGVVALRGEVEELYRAGIDRSKLAHWEAAHDLVAASVPPAAGSKWARVVREFAEVEDPRPYVDEVLEDEFPLSIFYSTLKTKLAEVLAARGRAAAGASAARQTNKLAA
jgi:hypothetical protein